MLSPSSINPKIPDILINSKGYYVIIIGMTGKYEFVNPHFAKTFSSNNESIIGKPYQYSVYEKDLTALEKIVQECVSFPGVSYPIVLRKTIGIKLLITHWEFTCTVDEFNQPESIICIGHDITENEHNQRILEGYLLQINEYLDSITDGFFTLNNKWEFVRINCVFEEIVSLNRKDLLGNSFWNYFMDDPAQPYSASLRNAMEKNKTVRFEQEWNSNRLYSVTVYPSKEGIICFIRDITERKKNEIELKESELKLKAILNSTVDTNTLLDLNKKILSFNRVANELSLQNFGKEMKVGDDFLQYIPINFLKSFTENFNLALNGSIIKTEKEFNAPNGNVNWYEFLFYPVFDESHKIIGVVINSTSIDDRKKAELKVLKQYEQLKKIAYLQSHDLRAPLSNILGIMNVINLLKNKNTDPELTELLEGLSTNTLKIDTIINEIVLATTKDI